MADSLFTTLKERTGKLWSKAQQHPCVAALGDGTLPRKRFIHYLKQDYVYLVGYSRAIATATAKAPTLKLMNEFTALLNETLNTEMQLHRDYCASFGIKGAELAGTEASPICQAYIDFCISKASMGDCLDLLTAQLPCGVGYGEIGLRLKPQLDIKPEHPYRRWIETYSSDDYQSYTRWMIATMDTLGKGINADRLVELTQLFTLGCRYEWLFWELAWGDDEWPI